jgi:hypothetical protein
MVDQVPFVFSTDEERRLAEAVLDVVASRMPDHAFPVVPADEAPDAQVWVRFEATSGMVRKSGEFVRMSVFYRDQGSDEGNMHGPQSLLATDDGLEEWATFAERLIKRGFQPRVPLSTEAAAALDEPFEELARFTGQLTTLPRRVDRGLHELAERLTDHTALLIEYIDKVKKGDRRYLGEVAGKLRLLVSGRQAKNKPLLFLLADATGDDLTFQVGGPPGFNWGYGVGGQRASLAAYLDSMSFIVAGHTLTKAEVIVRWAQQHGSAHEDWQIDRSLYALTGNPMRIWGVPTADRTLISIAHTVAHVSRSYLDGLTPEALDAAERRRRGPTETVAT